MEEDNEEIDRKDLKYLSFYLMDKKNGYLPEE